MTEQFHVVFEGRIAEHADLDMVKHNVSRAFKLPPEQVDKLFSGKRIALKKNVDQATAEKYQSTLQRAGALCEIINSDPAAGQVAKSANQPAAGQTQGQEKTAPPEPVASPPATEPEASPTEKENGMSMAEVGVTLIKSEPVPDANIDTSGMDMDEVGVTLVESEPVPDANIDTSGMDMDEVGVTLVESEPVPDANIDTSSLSLSD